MVVETKSTVKRCDCCNAVIPERDAFLNDGSFQAESLDIGDVNVCVHCCGKIMIRFMSDDISEEQLKEWANDRGLSRSFGTTILPFTENFYGTCTNGVKDHVLYDDKEDGSILNTPVIT